MEGMPKMVRTITGIVSKCRYGANVRERNKRQRQNFSSNPLYAKANNKFMKDYNPIKKVIIFDVLGCEQSIWTSKVAKITC